MENLLGQLENLLTTPPGYLLYHLALIFTVTTVLQAGFGLSGFLPAKTRNRILSGAFFLFLLQVILFLNSALAWQGWEDANVYLPSIDRAVITMTYIWILWMWNFPKRSRFADTITIALTIAVIALLVFSVTAWKTQMVTIAFNSTLLDWSWSILYTIILFSGILLVLLHKPQGWGLALLFLNINLLGALAHMLWASPTSDFSASLRMALLCSFPLLPGLVYRLQKTPDPAGPESIVSSQTNAKPGVDWLQLSLAESPEAFFVSATHLTATEINACCCLWAAPTSNSQTELLGYNLQREQILQKSVVDIKSMNAVRKALGKKQPTTIDYNPLTKNEFEAINRIVTGLDRIERLYIYPVMENGKIFGNFLVAYQNQDEDQTAKTAVLLEKIQKPTIEFLEKREKQARQQGKEEALERELTAAHHQLNRQMEEIGGLKRKLNDLQSAVAVQDARENQVHRLETEITNLKTSPITGETGAAPSPKRSPQIPLIHVIDRVIDEASILLLERNISLQLDIPSKAANTLVDSEKGEILHSVLTNLFELACAVALEEKGLDFQVLFNRPVENSVQIVIKAVTSIEGEPRVMDQESFQAISRVLQKVSGIAVSRSVEGNQMRLNVVLAV